MLPFQFTIQKWPHAHEKHIPKKEKGMCGLNIRRRNQSKAKEPTHAKKQRQLLQKTGSK